MKVLHDSLYRIEEHNVYPWWIIFWKLYYMWEEINIRFKEKNLNNIINYIQYLIVKWNRLNKQNSIEKITLKDMLKNSNKKYFYR